MIEFHHIIGMEYGTLFPLRAVYTGMSMLPFPDKAFGCPRGPGYLRLLSRRLAAAAALDAGTFTFFAPAISFLLYRQINRLNSLGQGFYRIDQFLDGILQLGKVCLG